MARYSAQRACHP